MSRRASALVVPAYLVLALAFTWPLLRDAGRRIPSDSQPVDALMQAFLLEWDWKTLARDPRHVYDVPNFHPHRGTLAWMDPLLGEAAFAAPLRAATGSVPAAYDALVIVSFVATGWAVYRLARLLAASRAGAFFAGFLAAFSHYRLANLALLNQLHTELVPLGLLFALRFLARGRTRDLALMALALALQSTFGWYGTFHLATALAVVAAWTTLRRAWPAGSGARVVVTALVACAALALVAVPHVRVQRGDPGFRRTLGQAALYSARPIDYLGIPRTTRGSGDAPSPKEGDPGRAAALGFATLALAAIGLAPPRRDPRDARAVAPPGGLERLAPERLMIVLLGVGFVLSLGPALDVAGGRLRIPLPYAALHLAVPGFASMRAPARFAELVILCASVLAGLGFDRLRARLSGRAVPALAFAGAMGLAIAETFRAPIAMVDYPSARDLPPVYAWLARQPGDGAVLELPIPARESDEAERDAVRQIHSLVHGKPRLDGVSGYSPPDHEAFRELMQRFPSPAAIAAAKARGARLVIVRFGEIDPANAAFLNAALAHAPELEPVARFGSDAVYGWRASAPDMPPPAR